jgi:hypothetical protein
MAINVKKLKRVIVEDEPLKEFDSGDKKPAFRQNGYGLTFDAANSDYLELDSTQTLVSDGDYITIKMFINTSASNEFIIGGDDRVAFLGNNKLWISVQGFSSYTTSLVQVDGINEVTIEILGGVIVATLNGISETINTLSSLSFTDIFKSSSSYVNGSIYNFSINTEQFNLSEGNGTTTTGSLGTVATLNTSHADGSDYVDYQMWDNPIMTPAYRNNYGQWLKNGNVLKLDSVNSDYLSLGSLITMNDNTSMILSLGVSQIDTSYTLCRGSGGDGAYAFGLLDTTNYIYITMGGYFRQLGEFGSISVGDISIKLDRENGINYVSVNGQTRVLLGNDNPFYIDRVYHYNNTVGYVYAYDFSINNEQFQFREGQGITTTGSLGTQAIINTSHADGSEYIDSQVWNESSEKWVDYK